MKRVAFLSLAALTALLVGCEVPELDVPESNPAPSPPAKQQAAEQETAAPTGPQQPSPVVSEPRAVTAKDPKKGKKMRAAGGYLGAVGAARFYAEHSLIFDNIKHTLDLYYAEHGEYPKTQDEFMKKIIQANQIKLPELDEGVEYFYDPADHLLKIQQSAKKTTPGDP